MNNYFSLFVCLVIFVLIPLDGGAQNVRQEKNLEVLLDDLSSSEAIPTMSKQDEESFIDPDFLKTDVKAFDDYPKVTVRILDKITAESQTFDLEVEKTVAYGSLRLRPMACKKTPPIEEPESASFLQVWEKMYEGTDQWVFSGWMFSSSPSLSAMEHPVYDVWVLDCKG
jgi:hypothetical protein